MSALVHTDPTGGAPLVCSCQPEQTNRHPSPPPSLEQAKELLQDLARLLQLAVGSARALCQDMDSTGGNLHELVGRGGAGVWGRGGA
jgi:hypothetical protein